MAQVLNVCRDPYLEGAYAPIDDERDDAELQVEGEIPAALRGTYLRNGPNPMFEPTGRYHIFDGDGMLHGVTLEDGRASYRNRWVRTRGLEAEIAADRALYGGMANADFPPPEVVGDAGSIKNVANTNVIRHAGRILCLWEAGLPTLVTPALDTVGTWDFDGKLVGPMTAHPKIDPETGELLFFGYSAVPPYLTYHVVDPSGALVRSVEIDLPAAVMIHDFVTTAEHVVFLDSPAVFDFASFARGGPMLTWQPDRGTRIGVMPRTGDGADIAWHEIDNCYVFHFMNAWSEHSRAEERDGRERGPSGPAAQPPRAGARTVGERVMIDASRISRMDIGLEGDEAETADADGCLSRFTVDLDAGRASWDRLGELPGDFPRVNDAFAGLANRYGYVATFSDGRPDQGKFDSVTKHDLARETAITHTFGPGRVTGEAVFAADPAGKAEDDGWLISFVSDDSSSGLSILDAHDLSPVASVALPRRVPFGFHGNWLPA